MADCCAASADKTEHPRKRVCPSCGTQCGEVSCRTIVHHIAHAWQWESSGQCYYFCDVPDCELVYFGDDDSVVLKSQLRTQVGIKEASADTLLCYCFGVSKADARNDPGIRDFVAAQTKLGLCSCATSNPSGRCCLKDFPRQHDAE